MRVAVTGASGHVGANLVRALLAQGRAVRCLIHNNDGASLAGLPIERTGGDVADRRSLEALFDGADVVYHLAAVISVDGDLGGRVTSVNVHGTRNAAEAALSAGVRRFVHCCSIHAFNQSPLDVPLDETRARAIDGGHPAYDRSKAAGEVAVREVIAKGLDAVILHPTGVIGPNDFGPSRMGQVLIDLYRRRFVALVEGGFDWVDVRDVVSGLLAAQEKGRAGESYILSGSWASVRALGELAAEVTGAPLPRFTSPMWLARAGAPFVSQFHRLFGGEPLYTRESLRALRANRTIVRAKAERELGYMARPLIETVRDTYAWLTEAGRLEPRTTSAR